MKRLIFVLAGLFVVASGCSSNKDTTVEPQSRGQRGESCQARNDCQSGLACINNVCSRNDFNISPQAKACDKIDCQADADCCGGRPTSVPVKCNKYSSVCSPYAQNCNSGDSCMTNSDCGGGTCGSGYCSNYSSQYCSADTDCANTCTTYGYCSLTGYSCTTSSDCTQGTCQYRTCSCSNPNYNPSDPICTDPDCTSAPCTLKCDQERCVENTACQTNADCYGGAPICNNGSCVQCIDDSGCSTSSGEKCVQNVCITPCTSNEECPLFQQCDTASGKCIETGCTSDTECILAMSQNGGQDARLAKCLPSDQDPSKKQCKVPCENDGACSQFQVCQNGFCVFIGCSTDEECRAYFGLENETSTTSHPWVTKAVCRAPTQ
jgi:hypothetical protein